MRNNMKKIEDIEKEYKEFQIKTDYIKDYKDFIAFSQEIGVMCHTLNGQV